MSEQSTHRHQQILDEFDRTKGGFKLKAHTTMYAVNENGEPAGIIGDIYQNNRFRYWKWTDEGLSFYWKPEYGEDYDLPFAPARQPLLDEEMKQYLPPTYMSFGDALVHLKAGKKIARKIWGGYWKLVDAEFRGLDTGLGLEQTQIILAYLRGGGVEAAQPYQSDWLAEDWYVLKD
jgi:hypothetical protein